MTSIARCDYCGDLIETSYNGTFSAGYRIKISEPESGHSEQFADFCPGDCWDSVKAGLEVLLEAGPAIENIPTKGKT